jgi:hypothetical protein
MQHLFLACHTPKAKFICRLSFVIRPLSLVLSVNRRDRTAISLDICDRSDRFKIGIQFRPKLIEDRLNGIDRLNR